MEHFFNSNGQNPACLTHVSSHNDVNFIGTILQWTESDKLAHIMALAMGLLKVELH